jgi:hypothetical protein
VPENDHPIAGLPGAAGRLQLPEYLVGIGVALSRRSDRRSQSGTDSRAPRSARRTAAHGSRSCRCRGTSAYRGRWTPRASTLRTGHAIALVALSLRAPPHHYSLHSRSPVPTFRRVPIVQPGRLDADQGHSRSVWHTQCRPTGDTPAGCCSTARLPGAGCRGLHRDRRPDRRCLAPLRASNASCCE